MVQCASLRAMYKKLLTKADIRCVRSILSPSWSLSHTHTPHTYTHTHTALHTTHTHTHTEVSDVITELSIRQVEYQHSCIDRHIMFKLICMFWVQAACNPSDAIVTGNSIELLMTCYICLFIYMYVHIYIYFLIYLVRFCCCCCCFFDDFKFCFFSTFFSHPFSSISPLLKHFLYIF